MEGRRENPPDLKRRLCSEEDAGSNPKWRVMTDWRGVGLGLEFGGAQKMKVWKLGGAGGGVGGRTGRDVQVGIPLSGISN